MPRSYSDQRYGVSVSSPFAFNVTMNAAAGTNRASWSPPVDENTASMSVKLHRVSVIPITAGTLAGSTFNLFKGTTSIGVVAVGAAAANAILNSGSLSTVFTSTDVLNVQNSGSDATGAHTIMAEWQETFIA